MREKVQITHAGKSYTGYFKVERDTLTVENNFEEKATNVRDLGPAAVEGMAKLLLGELIDEGKAKPDHA